METKAISGRLLTHIRVLLLIAALAVITSAQQSSLVDPTFNAILQKNASSASPTDFVLQPDGKFIVFGPFLNLNGAPSSGVARLNPDGTGDNTFNCTGCNFTVRSAAVQADGKIIIAGDGVQNNVQQPRVSRLNADGSVDTTFASPYPPLTGGAIPVSATLSVIGIQNDGRIIVVYDAYVNGTSGQGADRLLPSGAIDSSYARPTIGSSGHFATSSNRVNKAILQPDGKLLCARGYFNNLIFQGTMDRYNADGTVDSTFQRPVAAPGTGDAIIRSFDVLPDGSMVIGGSFATVNAITRLNIAKLYPVGNVDLTFNISSINSAIKIVRAWPNGKFVVSTANAFYGFNADGTPDPSFISPTNVSQIVNWTFDGAGNLVVLGTIDGATKIARYLPNGTVESFLLISGTAASTTAIAQQPDGKIVIAGDFLYVNGASRVALGRLNTNGTIDPTFNSANGFVGTVSRLIVQPDEKILIAGSSMNLNGVALPSIARLNADGTLDTTFAPVLSQGTFKTIALQADGKILIGGGSGTVNGASRTGVARLLADGSLDAAFNPIFGTPSIAALTVQSDGKIMVGGTFSGVNGFNRSNLVRLNADGSVDGAFTNAESSGVSQIELRVDGKYVVLRGGIGIVRLNNDGSVDSSFVPPTFSQGTDDRVYCILVRPDGSVLAGGKFTSVNGSAKLNIVRIGPTGNTLDVVFLPGGANATVRTLVKQYDGRVLAGGDFSTIGGTARWGIARFYVARHLFHTVAD